MCSDASGRSRLTGYTLWRSIMASRQATKTSLTFSGPEKPVVVTWVDAVTEIGWDEGAKTKVSKVTSLGWLMSTTEQEVVIASDISQEPGSPLSTNRRIAIPKSWIKSIKDIKL
jgi:hypothetical protein